MSSPSTVAAAIAAGVLLSPFIQPEAHSQSERRVMITDDGSGPSFMMMMGHDPRKIRTPDYVHEDLPIFREKLRLDESQHAVLLGLLEQYHASFNALAEKHLPPMPQIHQRMLGHPDGNGEMNGPPPEIEKLVRELRESGALPEGAEYKSEVNVAVRVGESDSDDNEDVSVWVGERAGDEGPNVEVAIATEGAEIPEELREKIEKAAQELAEKMRARIQEQIDSGELDLAAGDLPVGGNVNDMMQAHDERQAKIAAFKQAADALTHEFEVSVQSELEDAQLEQWPALQRMLVRRKSLPEGRLDGERTDLIEVLSELELDDAANESLQQTLEAYEITITDALKRRDAFLETSDTKVEEAIRNSAPNEAMPIVRRERELREAVRRINREYTDGIAFALGDAHAQQYRHSVLKTSFPRAYRRTTGERAFETARQLEDISENTLVQILEIETPYRFELDRINERIQRAIEAHQPDEITQPIEHMEALMNGEQPAVNPMDNPIRELLDQRAALDRKYVELLKGLLTPEQVAQLPTLRDPSRRGPFIIHRSASPD